MTHVDVAGIGSELGFSLGSWELADFSGLLNNLSIIKNAFYIQKNGSKSGVLAKKSKISKKSAFSFQGLR
ncbi:hypothetical protein [Polaromonas sp.]